MTGQGADRLTVAALFGVTAAATIGCMRLFDGTSFLLPSLVCAAIAHLLASLTRRVGPVVATVVALTTGLITVGVVVFPETTAYGVPTVATWHTAVDALSQAWNALSVVRAPVTATPGFVCALAVMIWVSAWTSDRLLFALDATVESTAPAIVLFCFATILSGPDHRLLAGAVLATALVLLAATVRSRAQLGRSDVGIGTRTLFRTNLSAGVICGTTAVALAIGAVVFVPGMSGTGVVDLRGTDRSPATRSVVSPLVDIRNRLLDQSDLELFSVSATNPAYWRLMALDDFDGDVWSSNQSFKDASGELKRPGSSTFAVSTQEATFAVTGLSGPWAPAPYLAMGVEGTEQLLWDAESATLIVDADLGSVDGLHYTVDAGLPDVSEAQARAAVGDIPEVVAKRDLALPGDFPDRLRELAADITDGAATPFDKALALQSYFRDDAHFTYSLDVPPGQGIDAMTDFLTEGAGYCEQFAGTYAALARAAGLPTRVVVGFTPGDPDPADPDTYVVSGRYAHAWPEVFIAGLGWLPFEPTPGRGNPNAGYTRVDPEQSAPRGDAHAAPVPAPSVAPTTTTPAEPTSSTTPSSAPPVTDPTKDPLVGPGTPGSSRTPPAWLLAMTGAIVLVTAGAALSARRNTRLLAARRTNARTPAERTLLAWTEMAEAFAPTKTTRRPTETHLDFGDRLGSHLAETVPSWPVTLRPDRLAAAASQAAWKSGGVTQDVADQAIDDAHALISVAQAQMTRRQRLARLIIPMRR